MGGAERDKRFGELVGKIRRLHHDTIDPVPARTPPRRLRHGDPGAPAAVLAPAEPSALGEAAPDHERHDYQRAGLQRGVLRKLRRGHYPIEDELDLHGMTVREAGVRLGAFLDAARGERARCVRIIHGKGLSSPQRMPVLKPQVMRWLRGHHGVLAFVPARREDGGDGAMYVLLRSRA